ncbi:hypothetical protein [Aestuariirhabdus litorea]|uniref:Uncharacterized protein n=1 Tax=Aestuariirhabdus litorea TaxID=2528527 RepID=A0A3P3VPX2_9GAMM|nr:hypothetical protein [Aestuariirhabdus litorea]RRJ83639.1 hypothetical protein D0544_00495 [Aestuariirhabdus litorea]RWW96860.1 hypothetical protein DZC74_00495 [Endozoicomonadaceae bacterium GTF-13]
MNYNNQLTYVLLTSPSFLVMSYLLMGSGYVIWGIGGLIVYFSSWIFYRVTVIRAVNEGKSAGLWALIYMGVQISMISMLVVGIYLSATKPV